MSETVPLYMARDGLGPARDAVALRESGEVAPTRITLGTGEAWLVTRYGDVRAVLGDPERFSNAVTVFAGESEAGAGPSTEQRQRMRKGQLLAYDPPEHTQLRRILTPEFTMRRLRALEPRIGEIVDEHLDLLERLGPGADLVPNFALPIPSLVICELLGVPYADRAGFQERTSRQTDTSLPAEERSRLGRDGLVYMRGLVERAQADPGEDILGMLVREHSDEPSAVNGAIEELLRFLSVAHSGIPRTATTDVEVGGTTIRAGEKVLFALSPANRDPRFLDDPDTLDLTRKPGAHVAFGHGPHHCLGAPLARAELRVALPAMLRRFPNLALGVPFDEIPFRPHHVVYGVASLPVTW